jgi:hypothetical protein
MAAQSLEAPWPAPWSATHEGAAKWKKTAFAATGINGFKSEVKQPGKRAHPRRIVMIGMFRTLAACGVVLSTVAAADAQGIDWAKIDGIFGRTGPISGAIHRWGFPRSDLQVTLDGVTIRPTLALGGWIAFQPMGNTAMAMGDLVVLQTEVSPVMAKLLEGGLEVTAVHNHLLRAEPPTFYMHVGGHGDPVKMAETIRDALAVSKTPLTPAAPPAQPPAIDLDTAQIDQIIGAKGANNGGVYAINVPRRDPITDQGMAVGAPIMGGANAINFQPTGGGKAAITGDYALIGSEVPDVLRTLRANGIEVTAIHSHMLTEEPRIIFVHF